MNEINVSFKLNEDDLKCVMKVVKDNFFNGVKMNTNQNVHTLKHHAHDVVKKSQ